MKVNFNNANTPLSGVSGGAVQNSAQTLGHANSSPAFEGKTEVGKSLYRKYEDSIIDKIFKFKWIPKDKVVSEKAENFYNVLGKGKTHHNRLIIGAFAFLTQPWIDLFNPDVDKETKKMSFVRTMAKITVGTATGFAVRWGCSEWMKKFTKTEKELGSAKNIKKATLFMPTDKKAVELLNKSKTLMGHHRNVIGTFVAIFVMMITDPPLTVFMTNLFNKQKKQLEVKKALEAAKIEQQNNSAAKEVSNG